MSTNHDLIISQEPALGHHLDPPHRKISIQEHGHDNPGFDSPRSRKISSNSDHTEIGPVRKKSILHNSSHAVTDPESAKVNGVGDSRIKKQSVTDSLHSKTRFSDIEEDDRSWWYSFCLKCRPKETLPSWQPPLWAKICPHPFCPTYRQFSRFIALVLIGTLTWCILYSIIGNSVAPGGQLFQLILLSICSYLGGWLMSLTTLPDLIGMLFVGLLFQNVGIVNINEDFAHITKELRNVALVIILTRAGLDLDPTALKKLKFTVLKLSIGPWLVEVVIAAVLGHYVLGLPWSYGFLLGPIMAAVSPAIVVPCLFRLRVKGYGVAKGIPTLIIAGAGIDDALSVAIFGIVKSIMFSNDSLTVQIIQGPVSVFGGIGFGLLWGIISNYAPERRDPFMVPLRVIMLLVGGMVAVFGSEVIGYGGAGPLGCVSAAFVSLCFWVRSGWEIEENPAATAFEIFWMIFQPVLFGVTGAAVKFHELNSKVVTVGLGVILAGVVIRMFATTIMGIGCKLNLKEKLFIAFAWMSKATVQAALSPIALSMVQKGTEDYEYAEKILAVGVLSILLTAPLGATLITLTGTRLLTKTKFPEVPEGWRRSHRPSIRDISIIDEDEERDHIEASDSTTNISQIKDSPHSPTS